MLHANQIGANAVAQGAPKRSGFTEARGARRQKPGPRIAALWFENQAVGICRAEGFELVRRTATCTRAPPARVNSVAQSTRAPHRRSGVARTPGNEMQTMQPSSDAKDAPRISGRDIALIRQSQTKSKYNQLTIEE